MLHLSEKGLADLISLSKELRDLKENYGNTYPHIISLVQHHLDTMRRAGSTGVLKIASDGKIEYSDDRNKFIF
jgi:hypothetical protein